MFAPQRVWWEPLHRLEKSWVIIAFVWCLFLTAMMPIWLIVGKQNVPAETIRVNTESYAQQVEEFAAQYEIVNAAGDTVVAPPPGDVYAYARQFFFYPALQLEKGEEYRIHMSSLDVQHGLSIQPVNLNFQVLPGYDYVITLTPTEAGEFTIVCNEFCGIGHHGMFGKITVTE